MIEFNGDYWHGNPNKYVADDIIKHLRTDVSAKVLWDRDLTKKNIADPAGFEVLTVWESDWNNKRGLTINNLIEKLNESIG